MLQRSISRTWGICAAMLIGLMLALPLLADTTASTTTRGKITAVSATSITVQPRQGDAKTFTINAQTTITLDGKTAAATDLAVDQHAKIASTDGTTAVTITARTHKAPATPPANP